MTTPIEQVAEILGQHFIAQRHPWKAADQWLSPCSCGWESMRGYTPAGVERQARLHLAEALAAAGLIATETEWAVRWHTDPAEIRTAVDEDDIPLYGPLWIPQTRNVTPWKGADA